MGVEHGEGDRKYRHPGQAFLSRYGALQREQDVSRYVEFLRQEAGLGDTPPIDLSLIYRHFGIPTPRRAPLDEQQGILVDSRTGMILIKEDDPLVRQRFTEGHELMELLFDAQEQARTESFLPNWSADRKERLCDQGAADLLMPQTSFLPRLNELGLSLSTGRSLAALYQTSLLATLVRMVQYGTGEHALVLWHHALTQRESAQTASSSIKAKKKLRIWWSIRTDDWRGGFIPKHKSIAPDSLIAKTHLKGHHHSGTETIHLGWGEVRCQVEAIPIAFGDQSCVLSLLHRSGSD
ncbi:ImmA/IrrE family metallo-endopeptidase (plasmid) [Kovacikia minuta CCNUW1]|uniref:ImmA/IrrE family metallo-endopeptidase n=1 Tax=Kovacikia minuta TaxID=2931930 RepID=UPI001CC92464|nr:ImmA/IrrE family metallo-endopeptidase [Kovacikia minuta]UBF30324.1 ImmA/IrrE family metallo-endopeptidase [Kovacikia minuta CCNUW1]